VKAEGATVLHSSSPDVRQVDLILKGNNVTTIEGRFDINASIIVEENATLILKNAIINFTQKRLLLHQMTFRNPVNGNPRLRVENATITSNYPLYVQFYHNSSATVYNLNTPWQIFLIARDSSFVSISNSTIEGSLYARGSSAINVSNSTIRYLSIRSDSSDCRIFELEPGFFSSWNYWLDCSVVVAPSGYAPEVTLEDSQIENWDFEFLGSSNATISNSTIYYLRTRDSTVVTASNSIIIDILSAYGHSVVWLVNSNYSAYFIRDESKVYVGWYLDVHVVDSIGQNVPSANVTATYPDATVAGWRLTDANGWTRLTLAEKMMNATGDYLIGNYTITATYEVHTGQQSINMTDHQEITITLPFIMPESPPETPQALIPPSLIIISLIIGLIIILIMGVLIKRRKISHEKQRFALKQVCAR
jgi:hypothetical protein